MVPGTPLIITLYVHCLSWNCLGFFFSGYCTVCLIRKIQERDFVLDNGKCDFQSIFFTIMSIAEIILCQLLMNG